MTTIKKSLSEFSIGESSLLDCVVTFSGKEKDGKIYADIVGYNDIGRGKGTALGRVYLTDPIETAEHLHLEGVLTEERSYDNRLIFKMKSLLKDLGKYNPYANGQV